jgi:hypothetical protein
VFAGKHGKPGTGNDSFNGALGIDTDAQGRVYIADSNNSRVQIYAPDGKYLKTIKIDRPELVAVHTKTGAIYIQHTARVRGQSLRRLTKLVSFDNPRRTSTRTASRASSRWTPGRPSRVCGGPACSRSRPVTPTASDRR